MVITNDLQLLSENVFIKKTKIGMIQNSDLSWLKFACLATVFATNGCLVAELMKNRRRNDKLGPYLLDKQVKGRQ